MHIITPYSKIFTFLCFYAENVTDINKTKKNDTLYFHWEILLCLFYYFLKSANPYLIRYHFKLWYTHIYVHAYTYIFTCTYAYIYSYTHIYKHMHYCTWICTTRDRRAYRVTHQPKMIPNLNDLPYQQTIVTWLYWESVCVCVCVCTETWKSVPDFPWNFQKGKNL